MSWALNKSSGPGTLGLSLAGEKSPYFLPGWEVSEKSHKSETRKVASTQSLTQNIVFFLRRVFWTHPSDATCWTMCSQVKKKSPSRVSRNTHFNNKELENVFKWATNLPGQSRTLQIWQARPEELVQQEAFSYALPPHVTPLKTRNGLIYLCRPQPLLSSCPSAHACITHPPPLTLFSHFSPGILLELICSSSQGRIRILSTGIVTHLGRSCREQGTRLLICQAELPGNSSTSAQYTL